MKKKESNNQLEEPSNNRKKLSIEEKTEIVNRLRGIAAVEGKIPPTAEEVEEDYLNFILEKYK